MAYSRPDVRSWLDAGLQAHRAGDLARAAASYRQALALAPADPDALNLLGTALLQGGAAEEALPYLKQAARVARNNPHILANLGQCCFAVNDYDGAHDAFRKASRLDPSEPQFQVGAANALALQGKLEDAENILQRQAKRTPKSAAVWLSLGNVVRDRKRRQDAIDCYEKAVALEPALPDARNALGSALHSKLRFAEAEAQYRECLRLAPDHLSALFNHASVLMDLGRFDESERAARALAGRLPHSADALRLVGTALGFQTRLVEAHAYYVRAAALEPTAAKFAESVAISAAEIGRTQESLRGFSRALALGADAATTRPLLASVLLGDGAIHDGWLEYRHRHDARIFRDKNPNVPIVQSAQGDLAGKHVCVIGEQGLGDEIFFLRYGTALAQRGARLTYRAGAKIAPLLARVPWLATVMPPDAPLPPADVYLLVADLPHALHDLPSSALPDTPPALASIRDFARRTSVYWPPVPQTIALEPLPERIARVRDRIEDFGPPPYVGLTWRAGTPPEEQRSTNWVLYKSVPLDAFGRVFAGGKGTLLNLQRGPAAAEIEAIEAASGRKVHDVSALNDDLEEMLALLAVIDEYVGVSNTNMHLRASVGRTARVLVPAPAEWRWMRSGAASPWFPGFSIYRQTLQGDWAAALLALQRDLAEARPLTASSI